MFKISPSFKRILCISFNEVNKPWMFNQTEHFSRSPVIFLQKKVIQSLEAIVGAKNVVTSNAVCEHHNHDESYHRYHNPECVVWPNCVKEVSDVAKICSQHRLPMIPYGTGTGVEGGVAPLVESICVNLTNMNSITDLNVDDLDVKVQPGVTRKHLNTDLRSTGLWFPVDPGADASLCGMAATSASGTNAVKYGTMKNNVHNLEVVLADGTIVHTGGEKRRCRKSSAGYNLTDLFVGSEGTLGFITSATLKLHPIPQCVLSAVCSFPTISDAVNTVTQVMQSCIPIARIELLDHVIMSAVNKFNKLEYDVAPTLFLEFHGSETETKEQVDITGEIAAENSGSNFKWAETQEEKNRLWQARHDVLYAITATRPGTNAYSTDVCVPITSLPQAIEHSVAVLKTVNKEAGILGHVGDGNFHCLFTVDTTCNEEVMEVQKAADAIGRKGIELGGSCTGEHGIGMGKKSLLYEELGQSGIKVTQAIKRSLDPFNLMNPGKVINC